MRKVYSIFLVAMCLSAYVFAQDATSIVKKMDANLAKVKDKSVDIEMTMVNLSSGKTKVKQAVLLQKGFDKKMFRYTAPKGDSGIATLSLPNKEIYVYLPMFKKPKKMTNLAESKTFNKSDFSINDMANFGYSETYNLTLIETTGSAYRIEMLPKEENGEYGKLVMDINKSNYHPERTAYYNDKMVLEKVALYQHKMVSGIWVAEEVSMETVKKKHKTILKMSNFKLNNGLSDELFTVENMTPKG